MFKKRYFEADYDFKTAFLSKFFFGLAIFLLIIFLTLKFFSLTFNRSEGIIKIFYDLSTSTIPETVLSFSLIFFAAGFISYFFYRQFVKLAEIAEEIEKSDNIKDDNT